MLNFIQKQFKVKLEGRVLLAISLFLAIILIMVVNRIWAAIVLQQRTNVAVTPFVRTIVATRAPLTERIILPGSLTAWHEAPIYARTNGYVKKWYADIGDKVNQGDLLADIETPELNAQLRQAEADLNVVMAQKELAQITAVRWQNLVKTNFVSKQGADEKIHSASALSSSVTASRANYERLGELVAFNHVIAPFKGIVSARDVDVGDLINAGSNAAAKPLFRVIQSDPLRLYVNIPETYSSRIKPKMPVELQVAEYPGQGFNAQLINTANAIVPATRTLLAEFIVHNKEGKLLPGSYANVEFSMLSSSKNVLLPVNTLIFRAEGLQVATVDKNNRVVLKKITIGRDFGTYVEVNTGIVPGEHIIVNPADSIYQGEVVRTALTGDKKSGIKT